MKTLFLLVLNGVTVATLAQTSAKGLIFNDAAYQKLPMKPESTRSIYVDLPKSASLKAFCPKAGDQQAHQTCVGWAAGYAARTILYAKTRNLTNKDSITQNAFSPDFIYRSVEARSDCQIGIELPPALEVLKSKGIVFKKKLFPCPTQIPDSLVLQAKEHKIEDLVTLFLIDADTSLKINALKRSLAEGNPVVIGAYLPPSFTLLERNKDNWSPTEALETYLNRDPYGHAVCIVGYDDTKFGGAFEMQNSYGENWGTKGFCWVKYKDLAACTVYAFELINNIRPVGEAPRDSLVGDIQLVSPNNVAMQVARPTTGVYRTLQSYPAHTKFKAVLTNHAPAYLYVFATDNTFKMNALFPHSNLSPALTYRMNRLELPKNAYFELDTQAGTDIFCMLYSKTPLNLQELLQKLERASGSIQERLRQVLENQLIMPEHVLYDSQNIRFESDLHGKDIVPIIVEIPHH